MPRWANTPIDKVMHEDVVAWVAEMDAEGLSASTIKKAGGASREILALAVRSGAIRANPVDGTKLPTGPKAEHRDLTPAELEALNDLGTIRIPHTWVAQRRGLELAYAMTSFSIQGATNDASSSIVTRGASAAELLVNLTRGRHQNLVFAIADGDDEFAGEQPSDIMNRIAAGTRVRTSAPAVRAAPTHADDGLQLGL